MTHTENNKLSALRNLSVSQKIALILLVSLFFLIAILATLKGLDQKKPVPPDMGQTASPISIDPHKRFTQDAGQKTMFNHDSSLEKEKFSEEQREVKQALSQGQSYLGTTFGELKTVPKKTLDSKKPDVDQHVKNPPKQQAPSIKKKADDTQQHRNLSEYDKWFDNYKANLNTSMTKNMRSKIHQIMNTSQAGGVKVIQGTNYNHYAHSNGLEQKNGSFLQKYQNNDITKSDLHISSDLSDGTKILPGDTYFSVMVSAVNSDSPGPVVAKVVSGKLRGAKLLGGFVRNKDTVSIKFNHMIYERTDYPISAVSVDANTYATALADSVDHHYLERYGLFFAGSFLGGISNAIMSEGQTTTTDISTQTSKPQLNTRDKILVGLGNTGNQLAPKLESNFDIPPTVKVNKGTGVGVLFLSAIKLKHHAYYYQTPQWELDFHKS